MRPIALVRALGGARGRVLEPAARTRAARGARRSAPRRRRGRARDRRAIRTTLHAAASAARPGPSRPRARSWRGRRGRHHVRAALGTAVEQGRRRRESARGALTTPTKRLDCCPSSTTCRARSSASSVPARRRVVLDPDLGLDALAEDRLAVGGEVLADRQVECAALGQVDDLLEGALAVGARPDDGRDVVDLQRRGEDLGRRGRVAVDQDRPSASGRARHRPRRRCGRPGCGSRSRRSRRSGRRCSRVRTASLSRPPPLPRRSSTRPLAPCAYRRSISWRSSPWTPSEKVCEGRRSRSCRRRPSRAGRRPPGAGPRRARRRRPRPAVARLELQLDRRPRLALDLRRRRPRRRDRRSTCRRPR